MFERLLTKESAEILLARHDGIWDEIWACKRELLIAQIELKKGKLMLKFRGRFITPREFSDIRARFKELPERRPELIQPGKLSEIANQEVSIAERFLGNILYPEALDEVAATEELIKNILRREKAG